MEPYRRARFGDGWADLDGDRCRTRCEVLERDRRASLPGLPAGGWLSVYDGLVTDNAQDLQVDHIVPLAEAWRSGASTWSDDRRVAFSNWMDNLLPVTGSQNQAKSDKEPSAWLPRDRSYWCTYVTKWVTTKLEWGLSADEEERQGLASIASSCG